MQVDRIRQYMHMRRWLVIMAVSALALVLCREQVLHTLVAGRGFFGDRYDYNIRYPYLLEEFRRLFDAGTWYPRWIYRLYGGYGYPTFLLYPPGYWFFCLPFTYLTSSADKAATLANVANVALALAACYHIARILGSRTVTALALVALAAMGRIWSDSAAYYSIGLSTRFADSFSLWGVYCLLLFHQRLMEGGKVGWPLAGWIVAGTAVLYTHPFESVFHGVLCGLLTLGMLLRKESHGRRLRMVLMLAAGAGIMLALSSPHWLTQYYFSDKVSLHTAFSGSHTPQGVLRGAGPDGLFYHHFYPPFAMLHLAIAVAACIACLRTVWMLPLVLLYPLLVFLLVKASYPLWGLPVLRSLMNPLRIEPLLLSIEFLALCVAAGKVRMFQMRHVALALLALFTGTLYATHSNWWRIWQPPFVVQYKPLHGHLDHTQYLTFQGWDEFRPLTASVGGLPNRHRDNIRTVTLAQPPAGGIYRIYEDSYDLTYPPVARLILDEHGNYPLRLLVNQFYFPGWRVTLDGQDIPYMPPTALPDAAQESASYFTHDRNGRILVSMSGPGNYQLRAWYDGPPGWGLRNIAIVVIVAALSAALWALSRNRRAG